MPAASSGTQDSDTAIGRILSLAHAHLGLDASFISQTADGVQVVRAVAGEAEAFGLALNEPAGTNCQVLAGKDAPPVEPGREGGQPCVGVPLSLPNGDVYGTLCCVGRQLESLDASDRQFMTTLADLLGDQLRSDEQRRRQYSDLLEVASAQQLSVALQPVVNAANGRLAGVEALPRYPDQLGAPDQVLERAKTMGLAIDLEVAALEAGLRLANTVPAGAYLAMDVSPAVLMDRRAFDILQGVDDPARCVLELSEQHSIDGHDDLTPLLRQLRGQGFRVAVDDVGAGYSSFHHVLELVPDIIKIDSALVTGVAGDPVRQRLISSIVLLGLDLAAAVVADGVDEQADLAAVLDLGVSFVQGNLIGRPTAELAEVAVWQEGWHLRTAPPKSLQTERRARFGALLRQLRGERRQIDVVRAVNDHLAAAGEDLRVSQGQYSAYEHGRELPLPIRLRAIEVVLGVEPGDLASKVPVGRDGGRTGSRRRTARNALQTSAARQAELRRRRLEP